MRVFEVREFRGIKADSKVGDDPEESSVRIFRGYLNSERFTKDYDSLVACLFDAAARLNQDKENHD